jgi:hypothetical protein
LVRSPVERSEAQCSVLAGNRQPLAVLDGKNAEKVAQVTRSSQ